MAKQPRYLYGKVAAITGAARGIGFATAQALAREGIKVSIGDLDRDLAEQAAGRIGGDAKAFALDVTDRESFERFLDETEAALGPVDILVNNAGIMQLGPFHEEDDATAIRQVDINVHGVITGTKLALDRMLPRNRGHIVQISSSAGRTGVPGGATYSATKFAVYGLTEALRGELKHMNADIDLSVVMPVVVQTELADGLPRTRGFKFVTPEDVAEAIVEALKFGGFDVFVPKSVGTIRRTMNFLPRGAQESVGRAIKADRVLWDFDRSVRKGYELRASHSEPALEQGNGQKQLSPPSATQR